MSWYDKDLVTCFKCGRQFSTPIDKFSHQNNGCHVTRKTYPNGSYEVHHDQLKFLMCIVAKNPFGTTWRMNRKERLYGAGGDGIHRKGRKWTPHMTDEGWVWL